MLWKALVPPQIDHRVRVLPVVVLNIISTCDSRCVACDYWRSPNGPRLGLQAVRDLLPELRKLGTKRVLLSGGEPLVHPDLPDLAELLHREGFGVLLHSNGLRLAERLSEIGPHVQQLFLSLDGASRETYRRLRGVDGLPRVLGGIRQARLRFPRLRLGSRTVLMRGNLNELPAIVETGLSLGLEPMSFLAADLHSDAFGRNPRGPKPANSRLPTEEELDELSRSIEELRNRLAATAQRVIEGGLASIERIALRYRRLIRGEPLEAPRCDAPWHSVVVEPDGAVRPCFFHTAYGRLSDADLLSLLNGPAAVSFRKNLDVAQHSLCRQCVCWKQFGWRERHPAFSP
jgi:MoaA/NifB/PqqE/SkfB family radical SAM enzyme